MRLTTLSVSRGSCMITFNPLLGKVVSLFPRSSWNHLSLIIASLSKKTIKDRIEIKHKNGFILKEYRIEEMPDTLWIEFVQFCYPRDNPDRLSEITLDERYWRNSSFFLVFDANKKIVGCIQYIFKTPDLKLPVEYGCAVSENGTDESRKQFDATEDVGVASCGEIYRLKSDQTLCNDGSCAVSMMLFKAIWMKGIQAKVEFSYISYDLDNKMLRNLYLKRLYFQNPHLNIQYGDSPKKWGLLRKSWPMHESNFASLSLVHFFMQTYFRQGMIESPILTQPVTIKNAPKIKTDAGWVWAEVYSAKNKKLAPKKKYGPVKAVLFAPDPKFKEKQKQ